MTGTTWRFLVVVSVNVTPVTNENETSGMLQIVLIAEVRGS